MPRVETILARGFFVSRAASEFPLFVGVVHIGGEFLVLDS